MNKDKGTSYFYCEAEFLLTINRRNEAINLIEKLGNRIGNRQSGLYEASRYFFWRGLPDYGLIFLDLALDGHKNNDVCLKHKEEILLKSKGRAV